MRSGERLDAIDLKILSELQKDGRIQNNTLADRVGISPPPCLRRVRALVLGGVIKSIRAILDERMLGYEVVSFVFIQLDAQSENALKSFEDAVNSSAKIQQCWLLSGENDYLLRCVATDVAEMQALILGFSTMSNVRNVKSSLVLQAIKDVPLPLRKSLAGGEVTERP